MDQHLTNHNQEQKPATAAEAEGTAGGGGATVASLGALEFISSLKSPPEFQMSYIHLQKLSAGVKPIPLPEHETNYS